MISILMATYNGEKFISEQIESLLGQTVQDFILYINDDCSTDKTYSIACQYAERYPNKIFVSQNIQNTGSAKYNFMRMMIEHKNDYVMLCDQDDVWKPNKIALTLSRMHAMEAQYGVATPILVHSDLEVVDEKLKTTSSSFIKAMNADYSRTALNQIVIQNTLTGCTAMYNRTLANLIEIEPKYMIMHDWWLILVASAFGEIGHIKDRTIYYRQHEDNQIGAKNVRHLSYMINRVVHPRQIREAVAGTYKQAESFLKVFPEKFSPQQRTLLQRYCAIPTYNKLERIQNVLRLGTLKNGLCRRVAQIMFI